MLLQKKAQGLTLQVLNHKNTLNCKGRLVGLNQPHVMGIINVTDNSFWQNSRAMEVDKVLVQTETMLNEGATFIDIGAQSTRPGAEQYGAQHELKYVIPAIEAIIKHFPQTLISIDTYRASVAKEAIEAGASIINDISAGDDDPEMIPLVAELNVPYIIMHKQGTPQNMQINPQYEDVLLDVIRYFTFKVSHLQRLGVADIIIDPGFGFGKQLHHNFALLKNLSAFKLFELPILAGVSRKSMIQKTLGVNTENALNGTTALHMIALENGAKILRVHDVKEAVQCVKMHQALTQS